MSVHYHSGAFPPLDLNWQKLIKPIADASDAIGRYDSYLGIIPNPQLLLSPMLVNEAVTSSRIEGTHTTVHEVLAFDAGKTDVTDAQKADIQEVNNYRLALNSSLRMLETLPISGRVLRSAHEILLDGVRGQFKSPGKYRVEQNWIGRSNKIEEARYVPISPDELEDAMAKWEKYVNESEDHPLIKIAVAHAEFEAIHPFNDGNGRIGRIVIPLMLCAEGVMSLSCFYMSEFFEHRNNEYQDRLLAVSSDGDWTGWCSFFLEAVAAQARENLGKAKRINLLYRDVRMGLVEESHSAFAEKAADALFSRPIFSARDFASEEGVKPKTARRLLGTLEEMGVVEELSPHSGQRSAIFYFPALLAITEDLQS